MNVTERDLELAKEACRNFARDGAFIFGEVARAIATGRAEGRWQILNYLKEQGVIDVVVMPAEFQS